MNYSSTIWLTLILSFSLTILVISTRVNPNSPDPECNKPDTRTLRSDQMTIIINGYSEHRIPLLHTITDAYSASPSIAAVVLLWCNPSTPIQTLKTLTLNLSATVLHAPSSSLNYRFYPWSIIKTRAVLICDDDIEPDLSSISFAFSIWRSDPDRVIGFFARSHSYDVVSKTWIYTMEREKYSIILTKLMILNIEHLVSYSCNEEYADLRRIVEERNNCEDILMNFVVADGIEKGPVMIGAKAKGAGIRDYGDARNDGVLLEVGLSSRVVEHRKRRGECVSEFHRVLGRMPLKYSYGKVVSGGGGEQGLCEKQGKLVLCDQQN